MSHIRARVKICYIAHVILSCRLKTKGILAVEGLEKLNPVYKVYLSHGKGNFNWAKVVILTQEGKTILKLLGCSL